jgi:DNA-binding GntR family transcriptional regulator
VEHGVGTFVADWTRPYDLLQLPSFAEALRDGDTETRILGRDTGVRCAEAAGALALDADALLSMLTRLRLAHGSPLVIQRSYVGMDLAQVVRGYDSARSLYATLHAATGRVPASADEVLEPVTLEGVIAEALAAEQGSLGWRSRRTTLDAEGEPLIYDDAFFPAERMRIRVYRKANQAGVAFEAIF